MDVGVLVKSRHLSINFVKTTTIYFSENISLFSCGATNTPVLESCLYWVSRVNPPPACIVTRMQWIP